MSRLAAATAAAALLLLSPWSEALAGDGAAAEPAASPRPPIPPEVIGTWRFKDDTRPIKAVVIGGSVSAWARGNFGHYLAEVCPRVEIVNRGKSRIGARKLRERFDKQVIRNRRVRPDDHEALWLLFHGGLNSVGDPYATNRRVGSTFRLAHEHGIGTIALSLGPWGAETDKRWRGASGLTYQGHTGRAVDFVMGRLTPEEAFGPRRAGTAFEPGELPTIAIDLYDSGLRDHSAALRDEATARRSLERSRAIRGQLAALPEVERASAFEDLLDRARRIPQWYLRAELRAFDHIHPSSAGHRVIAQATCPELPATWGCVCERLPHLTWDRRARRLVEQRPAGAP